MDQSYEHVKSIAVTLIRGIDKNIPLTTELIAAKVKQAKELNPLWVSVDADALTRDLETQFNVWIGKSKTLEDQTNHKPWLAQRRGQIQWRYWERYKELLKERWAPASVDRLEEVTDEVLSRLEDPSREGSWDRRGLVVGHVQSGKTANYTGLINKAVDAGYRVIVVLAGVHKSLRSQTQIRLDEGFLGYESVAAVAANQGLKAVGVGAIAPDLRPNTITNRNDDGDFKRTVAERFQINPGQDPLLFVIKKNASVLKNLLEWVEWAARHRDAETDRPIVRNVPLLVIDDEADHASVDTKIQEFDEDGKPDPDHDPTVINRRIRRLLHCFEKAAYVGYTATPFANIFIHESAKTREEGDDLFPRSFIINLPAPSDYMGPLRVFGMDAHPDADVDASPGLPILRVIEDHVDDLDNPKKGWMPPKHTKAHIPRAEGGQELPESLREAVRAFVLSCAARRSRGQIKVHNSMLVHVTRFTDVQEKVFTQVKGFLSSLVERLRFGEGANSAPEIEKLRELWETDFVQTTGKIGTAAPMSWKDVSAHLWDAASAIELRRVNGTAPDILDYETHRETGLSVIAIGGDKLARGLTLEGLTVSYFLRAAKMYDTLMQMGRWFGYRPGYLDLCRMYMTDELQDWFRHVTAANEELRQEFDRMAAIGGTPRDYGLRVKSHPALLITSRVKMRNGVELDLSYAGDITETTVFRIDNKALEDNLSAVATLVKVLGSPTETDPSRERPDGRAENWKGTRLWGDVEPDAVAAFLASLLTHERAFKVNGRLMAEYVRGAASNGEITRWTVALVGKQDSKGDATVFDGIPEIGPVTLIERKSPHAHLTDRYAIRRVLNPRDEAIDLNVDRYAEALGKTRDGWSADGGRTANKEPPEIPSGPMIRQVRERGRALLLLYLLDHTKTVETLGKTLERPLVGFAVSFPADAKKTTVRYRVNNVFWEQEYGAAA